MTITFATIVNRGYCFLNVFRSGRRRTYPFATYGARSALLNDAAHGVLINTTYACSANDEELFSSPPLGARTHGLPMMTDWKSLSASCGPLHADLLFLHTDLLQESHSLRGRCENTCSTYLPEVAALGPNPKPSA